jgi:hypothetical protein
MTADNEIRKRDRRDRNERAVEKIEIGGWTVRVLDVPARLELKARIPEPREKDLFDIKALKSLLGESHGG